jgi:glyoxylase-like metal-dependent hydrolase (beta-lactamase superfamily II)
MKYSTIILSALLCASTAHAQPAPLETKVFRTSTSSFDTNIVLIMGEKKAVLVDAPFTRADAHRVVAMILESGRQLETIYITHDHPDHYYSVEVITQAFPDARLVAAPAVVADIWHSLPFKVKRWTQSLGSNGPRFQTAPAPLDGDTIMLEGREIKVIGPMQGDVAHATALWIASTLTLISGDLIYAQIFPWFVESSAAQIAEWGRSLDRLAALDPKTIIPGHSKPGLPFDAAALAFTRLYIAEWPRLVAASKDSKDLRARVKARFPQAEEALDEFGLVTSARVAMGEEKKWEE